MIMARRGGVGNKSSTTIRSSQQHKNKATRVQPSCAGHQKAQNDYESLLKGFSGLTLGGQSSSRHGVASGGSVKQMKREAYPVSRKEAPTKPGVYEIYEKGKQKAVYIGESKNARQRLYNHAYGKQGVDQFLRQAGEEAKVSVEVVSSKPRAESLEKAKLKEFVEKHGHLPKHNHRM